MPLKLLLIALGGAVGAVLRYLLGVAIGPHDIAAARFPTATAIINIVGCLAIGFLATAIRPGGLWEMREEYRLGLVIGVLGGFTTFSTFGRETFALMESQYYGLAGAYVVVSNAGGLAAVWLGHMLATSMLANPSNPIR